RHDAAGRERHRLVAQRADPELRARKVLEDRDGPPGARRGLAHERRGVGVLLVGAVGEVQARHVHPGLHHGEQHGGIAAGGTARTVARPRSGTACWRAPPCCWPASSAGSPTPTSTPAATSTATG